MGLVSYLKLKNYQFELTTSIYMLEPWEKMLFRVVLLLILALMAYSLKVYERDLAAGGLYVFDFIRGQLRHVGVDPDLDFVWHRVVEAGTKGAGTVRGWIPFGRDEL
eukprot:Nk52_evm27s153 gene=Nk52_evmTU27s153